MVLSIWEITPPGDCEKNIFLPHLEPRADFCEFDVPAALGLLVGVVPERDKVVVVCKSYHTSKGKRRN